MSKIVASVVMSALLVSSAYGNALTEKVRQEIMAALGAGLPIMVGKAVVGHRPEIQPENIQKIEESKGVVLVHLGNSACSEILSLKQSCNVKSMGCYWYSMSESRHVCH